MHVIMDYSLSIHFLQSMTGSQVKSQSIGMLIASIHSTDTV